MDEGKFAEFINYERERTERTNNPFSAIYIDISKIVQRSNGRNVKTIMKTIASSIRTVDRTGWVENNIIGVILPNTSIDGAKIVAEKLKSKLYARVGATILNKNLLINTFPEVIESRDYYFKATTRTPGIATKVKLLKTRSSHHSESFEAADDDAFFAFGKGRTGFLFNAQLFLKRLIDIVGATVGLISGAPLMVTVAAIIRLTSKGPAIFRQERLGYRGKRFVFLKFRSMFLNNDESVHRNYVEKLIKGNNEEANLGTHESPYYKIKHDPRITPLGRILRKTSIDELPQFFNVLMGHMSLVGPRPPIPYELGSYKNWHRKRILDVKPGITGLWQVKGRSSTTFDEMVRLDLHYARNWNLWLDIKILLGTFKAVFSARGAD